MFRTTFLPARREAAGWYLLVLCALVFGSLFAHPARSQVPTLDAEEQAFVGLLNAYRQQIGIATPLQVSIALTNAAKWHSGDMVQFGYFDHFDHFGRDPFERMQAFGYGYATFKAENIAAGNGTAAATFDQWRNSPLHDANMRDPAYRVIGIGRAAGGAYGHYWTLTFGGYVDAVLPTTTLSRTTASFSASGGTGSVEVAVGSQQPWSVVNHDPAFITVLSGGGNGPGTVTFAVAPHQGTAPRTGTITVGGVTFSVLQGVDYPDVPVTHPFHAYIGKLSARGVTLGCGGGRFCPEANVTREQMAIFVERAMGVFAPPTPSGQTFADVAASRISFSFVEDFAQRGITLGCSTAPSLFCPTGAVTREQMAIFVMRALGVFEPPIPGVQSFEDVSSSAYAYRFIEAFYARGITAGCAIGRYCPTSNVTRGQMAVFLVRAFDL